MRVQDVDAVQIGVYYEALAGFSLERVRDAASQWMQTGRFFPTTGEWATRCRELRYDASTWQPTVTFACPSCQDTGFRYSDCEAGARCGRTKCLQKGADWTHTYVARCGCFTSDDPEPGR